MAFFFFIVVLIIYAVCCGIKSAWEHLTGNSYEQVKKREKEKAEQERKEQAERNRIAKEEAKLSREKELHKKLSADRHELSELQNNMKFYLSSPQIIKLLDYCTSCGGRLENGCTECKFCRTKLNATQEAFHSSVRRISELRSDIEKINKELGL